MGRRKSEGEGLCGLLEMETEGKGRLQQVVCHRVGDERGMKFGRG